MKMRAADAEWNRQEQILDVRDKIWRYVSSAASGEALKLYAAAVLQIPASDVRTLGIVQFLTGDEVGRFVGDLPRLVRRLTTTTERQEEASAERVRGAIRWSKTFSYRAATGIPHLYVTAPAQRVFNTPENQLLLYLLRVIPELAKRIRWYRSKSEAAGKLVSERVAEVEKWGQLRMLAEIEFAPPSARTFADVRTGRHRRTYQAVIDAYQAHALLTRMLDREQIRRAVEEHALITSRDSILMELLSFFNVVDALSSSELAWKLEPLNVFLGGVGLNGTHSDGRGLSLWYQKAPKELVAGSIYRAVQRRHGLKNAPKRPDLVLRITKDDTTRWIVGEIKFREGGVNDAARSALADLLMYRRDFRKTLRGQTAPYGLGIAWGSNLLPIAHGSSEAAQTQDKGEEVVLCSPDRLVDALKMLT
ncbi:MAG: hypothetical protein H0U13_13795 [Gemmatimonadaceae bacterium]|nr:hypothetical protein [Gemmatimonadaceae bacterium]